MTLTNKETSRDWLDEFYACYNFVHGIKRTGSEESYSKQAYLQLKQILRQEPIDEPTDEERKEILDWFVTYITRYDFLQISHPHLGQKPTERDEKMYQKVVSLILSPKKVPKEFVEKWANELSMRELSMFGVGSNKDDFISKISQMLTEAGVEMEER